MEQVPRKIVEVVNLILAIDVGIAIVYMVIGFAVALFIDADEESVAWCVFLWPLIIVAVIIIALATLANNSLITVYRMLRDKLNG